MVEPSFLVGIAVLFVVALAFILKQTNVAPETEKKKVERKVNKQPKKTKGPQRNSLKKDRRPADVKEWVGVDNPQKDAQDMLEFLKGKDPAELAKQHNQGKGNKKKQQQQQQQGKKPKVQESSEDSASESEDGFSKIVKKPKIEKKKDNKKKKAEDKESRGPSNKPFFKPPPGAEGEVKPGEKKPKRERKPQSENAVPSTEGDAPQERKREKRERPEGERRERPEGERKERPEGERRERRENQDRPQRKPLPTVAPIVKYEQADLTDILASITQDFDRKPKPKPKANNKDSFKFYRSEIPTGIVVNILEKVEARDLVALSRVNHFFSSIARKDSLWRKLLFRDFGIKDAGKARNCRLAYKAEFVKKKKFAAKKKEENKVAEAPVEAVQQEESKNEDQSAAKEPKQKKDNKKKKAEEKPATDATAED